MAGEIQVRAQLSFAKGGNAAFFDSLVLALTMTGSAYVELEQTVGTAQEALILGDVAPGEAYIAVKNLDSTNYVNLKPATGAVVTVTVLPGECALFRFERNVVAPFVQADTAAVKIRYLLIVK
jgi:hypothetical protein